MLDSPSLCVLFVWRQSISTRTTNAWCLDFKLFKAKIIIHNQAYISLKYLRNLFFLIWKNGWFMQNHGLGRHTDTMRAENAIENTESIPEFIRLMCPISQNFWSILEKNVLGVLSPWISKCMIYEKFLRTTFSDTTTPFFCLFLIWLFSSKWKGGILDMHVALLKGVLKIYIMTLAETTLVIFWQIFWSNRCIRICIYSLNKCLLSTDGDEYLCST
jgi:hypothetical protein